MRFESPHGIIKEGIVETTTLLCNLDRCSKTPFTLDHSQSQLGCDGQTTGRHGSVCGGGKAQILTLPGILEILKT
ncbi:hypothetical protein RIF29_38737 [Crotalaria pallida]|uniref:Uncharacterized protein n=1 Tax=Crotalaria pallida TaxID=3830 RepID=A0AAN9E0E2_CROPI